METISLAQQILDIIDETICGQYIGKLEVITDDFKCDYKCCEKINPDCTTCDKYTGNWYTLNLFMNMHNAPLVLAYQGTEDGFKEYIKEEIKKRRLEKIMRYEVRRELPALENN